MDLNGNKSGWVSGGEGGDKGGREGEKGKIEVEESFFYNLKLTLIGRNQLGSALEESTTAQLWPEVR